jgi:hypothetical protein
MSWPHFSTTPVVWVRRVPVYRETYLVIGRRGGKSFMSALICVYIACFSNFSSYVNVGESLAVLCLARDRDQARIVLKYVRAILHHVAVLRQMIVRETADEIELTSGVTIMVKASDFGGVRGLTLCCVVCDELAFWSSQGVSPDDAVLAALRPAMSTIPTSKLLCISTGYAQCGSLYDAYRMHYGKDSHTLVWQGDSHSMNPNISEEFMRGEIEKDPVAGRSEWLGLFREDVSAAFPAELVESCVVTGRIELPYNSSFRYVSFDDVSGGRGDSWAKCIAHIERNMIVIDSLLSWHPPFNTEHVCKESAAICKKYHCTKTTGDRYSGEWAAQEFARNGIQYVASEKNRSELYLDAIPAFSAFKVELLDDPKMLLQFRRLERKRGRARDVIDHPLNGHDDLSNAVAGAISLLGSKPPVRSYEFPMAVGGRVASIPFGSTFTQAPPGGSTFAPRYWTEDDDDPPSGSVIGARIRGY